MKNKATHLIIYFLAYALSSVSVFSQAGKVKGRVFNATSNEPVAFANLGIAGTNIFTLTDTAGFYEFNGLKPGYYQIGAQAVGFESTITEEFHITNARTAFIEISMMEKPFELQQVVVKASAFKKTEESPVSLKSIGIAEIERSPGGNRDISRVIQVLPGVASGVSYRNDLIVRGGGPSENKFILDGIEIPNLNHFATQGASGGSVGIINSDFLREADLLTGAFPANRGNVLSSLLEMKLIDGNPEKMKYRAAVGASEVALSASGPLGNKTTMLLSIRRSYLQFLFSALRLPFLPTFNDYTVKVKTRLNEKNELTFLSIGSLDKSILNTEIDNPTEEQQYILSYLPSYDQWTYAIGGVYRHFREHSYYTVVLSRNMLDNASSKNENNDKNGNPVLRYNSQEIENKFRFENTYRRNRLKFISGFGFEEAKYTNQTYRKVFLPSADDTVTSMDYSSSIRFLKFNAFAQAGSGFFNERLVLSAGIRFDGNTYSEKMTNALNQFSPRFSFSYNLSEKFSINANAGRYFQQPSYTTLGYRNALGELVNKTNGIRYIRSDQIVAGVEFKREQQAQLSLEGFIKWYSHYPFSLIDSVSLASKGANYGVYGDEPAVSVSNGRAYGAELYLRDKLTENTAILLSYTFVRSEFEDRYGKLIPSAWDNRHILNLTISSQLGRNWNIGAKWRFVGGSPYTPYDLERSSVIEAWDARGQGYPDYNAFNANRLGSFQQLDIRIDKEYFFKKWSLNLYVDIQNAYNFKSKEPDALVPARDINGEPLIDPADPSRYSMKFIASESGTILPTIGFVIEL